MEGFNLLSEVNPTKSGWKVRVKVLRIWHLNWYLGQTIEMLICDEKGTRIHASIMPKQVPVYKDLIKEGDWKMLWWFIVKKETKFGLRPDDHPLKIDFLPHTTILNTDQVLDSLFLQPERFFDIIDRGIDPKYLIDVIGVVHGIGELREFKFAKSDGVITKLRFELINAERNIVLPCIVVGSLAREYYNQFMSLKDDLIICVLRFWEISDGKGIDKNPVVLASSNLSDFMFNPIDAEVDEFRSKFLMK